jgi:hypothetical protein
MDIIPELLGNGSIAPDNPLAQTKGTFEHLFGYSGGEFNGKDVDTKQTQEDFWSALKRQIHTYKTTKRGLKYMVNRIGNNWFSNQGFDSSGKIKIVRTLKCVADLMEHPYDANGEKIKPSEIKHILDYMIMARMFERKPNPPTQVQDAIEAFTDAIWEGFQ